MAAADRLARRHFGLTAENPAVGALVVHHGGDGRPRIVGRGVTAPGGRPHAERVALAAAGDLARGATCYVTLEPCAHHGRTGPCATALAEAGIARVVIGADDPDPRVDGRGREILRAAGVAVEEIRLPDAERGVEGFLSRLRRGRPFVTLKMAVSADGFVGRRGEGRVAVSGAVANRQVHLLRAASDAILVGIGTALADDPALTCRLPGLAGRSPMRVVLDRRLRLPPGSRLAAGARDVPLLVATAADQRGAAALWLEAMGARIAPLAPDGDLAALLRDLSGHGVSTLLVEGGPGVAAAFLGAGLVDRVVLLRSDRALGVADGVAAPPALLHLSGFRRSREDRFGGDRWIEFERVAR